MMNVLQFVGVRNMAAIPSGENVAVVPCGEGEVTCVALEAGGHQFVAEVKLDGFVDFGEVFQQGKRGREREAFGALGFRGEIKFRKDGVGCDELMLCSSLLPPIPSPVAHGDEFGLGPCLVIEARNGGFDVDDFAQRNTRVGAASSL